MYFPVGWPKELNIPELSQSSIHTVVCNRDKILFAILTDDTLYIWFCKPCVPIVFHQRSPESVLALGKNTLVEWRPDSSMLVVATEKGFLLLYALGVEADQKGLYEQVDSPSPRLRRDSAELFVKEVVPPLHLNLEREVPVEGQVLGLVCLRDELMVPTTLGHILRWRWDGSINRDYCLDLQRVPFSIDQQVSKAVPIQEKGTFVSGMEYSPLVGGFAVVLNDGRAAFLTASSLRFDPNQVQGIWAQNIEDATCASVNHKYRLIVFGRANSQCEVLSVDDATGALEVSHRTVLASRAYVGLVGAVRCVRWTPDGRAMAVAWARGGFSLWSTFGALLACSLAWDYGLHVDLQRANPLLCHSMEWSAEGYQLWMVNRQPVRGKDVIDSNAHIDANDNHSTLPHRDSVIQLDFVKSALTVNPCMGQQGHLFLQGEDRLYVNLGESWGRGFDASGALMANKQWTVVQIPSAYLSTNWPVRYTAIDAEGQHVAVAGRTGLAHYSLAARRWKLFGNESQEKDFVVTGGLLWWRSHVVLGCYSLVDHRDELRIYPRDSRLDNAFVHTVRLQGQVLLLSRLRDRLLVFCATGTLHLFALRVVPDTTPGSAGGAGGVRAERVQSIDASALSVHPACVVSVALTALRTDGPPHAQAAPGPGAGGGGGGDGDGEAQAPESLVINVSGRLLLVQRSGGGQRADDPFECAPPTVLASCVEHAWAPRRARREKPHLTEALWLLCGAHGMRVWLPLFPRSHAPPRAHSHGRGHAVARGEAFMSKRIMLPFQLSIYPLAILFEDAILLGAENDTMLYTSDASSPFSLPFCVLEKTSQVYLHQILRQLIRRNLGLHAWEIARSCTNLPYFPHSLELLLHEVLEEEATSKEPIPDALLPSVIAFIQEFPVYLQTVVQCARKTEIALWPYLFSAAGKPKDLFQECLATKQLDTAASYLIILQNLEPSSVSRQYATLLLDAALEECRWELSKDLVRFLRAIDPNDVESPRASYVLPSKYGLSPQTPPVSPNEEDLSLVLGTMQVSRARSFSTTAPPRPPPGDTPAPSTAPAAASASAGSAAGAGAGAPQGGAASDGSKSVPLRRKKSVPTGRDARAASASAEEFFLDAVLQRHARRLLSARRLHDLGRFAAHLDFQLVGWLRRERERAARIDCFVTALRALHADFEWPLPQLRSSQPHSPPQPPSPTAPAQEWGLSAGAAAAAVSTEALSVDVDSSGYRSSTGGGGGCYPYGGYGAYSGYGGGYVTADVCTSPIRGPGPRPRASLPSGGPPAGGGLSAGLVLEAHLLPHLLQDERSVLSEESSLWGEERGESVASEAPMLSGVGSGGGGPLGLPLARWQEHVPPPALLERLSQELTARGSPRAEVQLRYLLQLLSEAGCLEWALVVSVLLRDAMALLRTTAAARAPSGSHGASGAHGPGGAAPALARLRDGFNALAHWSATECQGYQPFFAAVQGQGALLSAAAAAAEAAAVSEAAARRRDSAASPPATGPAATPAASVLSASSAPADGAAARPAPPAPASASRGSSERRPSRGVPEAVFAPGEVGAGVVEGDEQGAVPAVAGASQPQDPSSCAVS